MAQSGQHYQVHVTPRARRNLIELHQGVFHIQTTAPPENGRASARAAELLAQGLGVAKSRLTLTMGAAHRDKLFRLD